jgi:hypothetical protein
MASKNKILGSGIVEEKVEVPEVVVKDIVEDTTEKTKPEVEVSTFTPLWLYRYDCTNGRIVDNEEDFKALVKEGWKQHPVV